MPKHSKPRAGSLQFWPRKKARKLLPSVNWKAVFSEKPGLRGLIAYKVGMASCIVKDLTPNSLTKEKRIFLPVTILETPAMKILSVRFYKEGKVMKEILAGDDKELKRKIKLPGKKFDLKKLEEIKDYDDIRLIVYSKVSETGIKKTPDIIEIALSGSLDEKLKFAKENLNKEISASEILKNINLVDVRGVTKGKGFSGPVKRFGIKLKQHKSEKGRRRPGSLAPWHPARITFRTPMAGQLGLFSRVSYNSKIINSGKISENQEKSSQSSDFSGPRKSGDFLGNINPEKGWKNYGKIKTEYIILQGSVPGAEKRQLLLTLPITPSKKQAKKKYEFVRLAK